MFFNLFKKFRQMGNLGMHQHENFCFSIMQVANVMRIYRFIGLKQNIDTLLSPC
jgi:hypothetical protein